MTTLSLGGTAAPPAEAITQEIANPRVAVLDTIKFQLRALLHWRADRRWHGFLRDHPLLDLIAQARPQLRWKLQRDYLAAGISTGKKLRWLMVHHEWALGLLPPAALRAVYADADQGLELACLPLEATGHDPLVLQVTLSACERFAKEGEWVLSIRIDGRRVAALAFTVHARDGSAPDAPDLCAHIGCLQGADGSHTQDLIRGATKAMHGLRPKQAVVQLLRSFVCDGLGLPAIIAVANQAHVYQTKRRTRDRVLADYDQFWLELGGTACGSHFELPAQAPEHKPLAEVPSKHRAQARRRRALEDNLRALVKARAQSWVQAARGNIAEPDGH